MISWIQSNFQRHFKIVFGLVLIGTIVSFIMTIGAAPGIGSGDKVATRNFFGRNLGTDMQRIINEAQISIELQIGSAGGLSEDQIKNYALQRVAALHLADELHLPASTLSEETDFIRSLRLFAGQNGQFDAQRYAMFHESLKNNPRTPEDSIAQVIADDTRIAKVESLLNGPGYVLPGDVKEQIVTADTLWTIATASVDFASFKPVINPTAAEIEKFFQQNSFRYEIPPRVVASAIVFPAANYFKGVTVTDAEIRAYYDENPSLFPAPKKPEAAAAKGQKPVKTKAEDPFADARPKVEAALKLERAKNLATKAASDLAYSLYDDNVPAGPALVSYLAARKLTLKPLAPFTSEAGPPELGGSPEIADAAFKLNSARYYSEAFPTPVGAAVLIWKETQPSRTPLLAEVRARVQADYVENERRQRFVTLGQTLKGQIADSLKTGASFEKACAAAAAQAGVKIETKTLPAFTLRARPKDLNDTVGGTLEHLEKGKVSPMVTTPDKGYLVYALDKKAPNLSEANPRFVEMRAQIAAYTARLGSEEYLAQMVDQELKSTEPAVK